MVMAKGRERKDRSKMRGGDVSGRDEMAGFDLVAAAGCLRPLAAVRALVSWAACFVAAAGLGCAGPGEEPDEAEAVPAGWVRCEAPRPEICTREYRPVCARLQDGSWKTYATGCTACADETVAGWIEGACLESD
jgi:hypothetical protein